jgi:hypothetical protein
VADIHLQERAFRHLSDSFFQMFLTHAQKPKSGNRKLAALFLRRARACLKGSWPPPRGGGSISA